jgi:uncharacterized protein YcbX
MNQPKVSALYIYPIKSLGPISLDSSHIDALGLKNDRRFMLVDANGQFISQRTFPGLVRFHLSINQKGEIEILDKVSHLRKILSYTPELGQKIPVKIWEDEVDARLVLEDFSDFFSDLLEIPVRLVMMDSASSRQTDHKHHTDLSKYTSFADSLPILVCTEASAKDLSEQVGAFNLMRFRPNLVISNDIPFEEDTWKEISIGEVRLFGAKPCARCNLVNVNPKTGTVSSEILKGLSSYRKFGQKVYFGQQFVPISLGQIHVGDVVDIVDTKDAIY